jgi:hypothetical protein
MKKFFAVLVIVSLVFAVSASASWTKLQSLGGLPVTLTNLDQIVNIYPSLISAYKNTAVSEMVYPGSIFAYTFVDTSLGVLGVSGSQVPTFSEPNMSGLFNSPFYNGATNPLGVSGIFYGTNVGKMDVGGYVLYGQRISDFDEHTFNKQKDSTSLANYSFVKMDGGVSLNAGLPIDASLAISIPGRIPYNSQDRQFDTKGNLQAEEWTGNSIVDYDLNVRTTINTWIVNGEFDIASAAYEDQTKIDANDNQKFTDAGDTWTINTANNTSMMANIIVGNIIKASDSLNITYGSGLNCTFFGDPTYATQEDKVAKTTTKVYAGTVTDTNEYIIPLYVAATCKLNDTWSFNAGVNKDVVDLRRITTISQNGTTGKKTNEFQETTISNNGLVSGALGVTGVIGDLTLDVNLNPAILLLGPNFISGQTATTPLAYSLAFSYKWGK